MSDVKIYYRGKYERKYHTHKCKITHRAKQKPKVMSERVAKEWNYSKCAYCAAIDGEREDPSKAHKGKGNNLAKRLEEASPEELGL